MKNKTILILALLFSPFFCFSQEMKTGFTYLETGKYEKADVFFKQILEEYPDNKTAKLCYGRAVGLSGNPQQATQIFTELLEKYPNDFEVKLNYGESLLWNKNFEAAEIYYQKLIIENDKS